MKQRLLVDGFGKLICTLTKEEANQLREKEQIVRISRNKYRLSAPPEPSKSDYSPAALTGGSRTHADGGDMHVLAGMQFSKDRTTKQQIERLKGWRLIPMGATT